MNIKRRGKFVLGIMGLLFLLAFIPSLSYAVPMTMNYQGYLTDSNGDPVDGTVDITFKIYSVSSGGSHLWTETHSSVEVTDGIFNVILAGLTTTILDGDRWLGIEVESDGEMTPRKKLSSVAYAIRAGLAESVVDGAVDTDALANDAVTGSKIAISTITSTNLDTNAVTEGKIALNAVTAAKMADNSVGSNEIQNGSISSGDLQDGATLAEISDDDGSGSGLDADYLDSQDGSYYRNASSINAGTLNNSRFSAYSDLSAEGYLGNSSGDLARNNGVLQANLNADMLDGKHDSDFAAVSHSHDHGSLSGLGDDDHTQYVLVNGLRAMTGELKVLSIEAGTATATDGDISAEIDLFCGNDLNVGNDANIADDADIGGNLTVTGSIEVGNSPYTPALGEISSEGGMWCGGTLEVQNNLYVYGGTKNAVVDTENYGKRLTYALESTEVWFEEFGSGKLENGVATIHLDPIFLETVTIDNDHPMKIFITLTANCKGVYVTKGIDSFQVIELNGGTSNASFDFRTIAKRKGYEDERLRELLPKDD